LSTAAESAAVSPGARPPTVPLPIRLQPRLASLTFPSGNDVEGSDGAVKLGATELLAGGGAVVVVVVVDGAVDVEPVVPGDGEDPRADAPPVVPVTGVVEGSPIGGAGMVGNGGSGTPSPPVALAMPLTMVGIRALRPVGLGVETTSLVNSMAGCWLDVRELAATVSAVRAAFVVGLRPVHKLTTPAVGTAAGGVKVGVTFGAEGAALCWIRLGQSEAE
jgi:hypothetical protein